MKGIEFEYEILTLYNYPDRILFSYSCMYK